MSNTPRTYKSSIITSIIDKISDHDLEQTESKMRLAIKIADAIATTGLSKSEFAKKLNKNNSEITKWISGKHNFTHDTLILLQSELHISLINSEIVQHFNIKNVQFIVYSSSKSINRQNYFGRFSRKKMNFSSYYSCDVT